MSLFPEEDVYTKEIESWKVFVDNLNSEVDKKMFLNMLEKCQKYALAINAKGRPFPTEPLIMALLLEQHKMINWLQTKIPVTNNDSLSVSYPKCPPKNDGRSGTVGSPTAGSPFCLGNLVCIRIHCLIFSNNVLDKKREPNDGSIPIETLQSGIIWSGL